MITPLLVAHYSALAYSFTLEADAYRARERAESLDPNAKPEARARSVEHCRRHAEFCASAADYYAAKARGENPPVEVSDAA
jgi:hypothetical protein